MFFSNPSREESDMVASNFLLFNDFLTWPVYDLHPPLRLHLWAPFTIRTQATGRSSSSSGANLSHSHIIFMLSLWLDSLRICVWLLQGALTCQEAFGACPTLFFSTLSHRQLVFFLACQLIFYPRSKGLAVLISLIRRLDCESIDERSYALEVNPMFHGPSCLN